MDKINTHKNQIYELMRNGGYGPIHIDYILANTNEKLPDFIFASVSNPNDLERGYEILISSTRAEITPIHDWQYNIDDALFEYLENGFEIEYMPLEQHYNFWCLLDTYCDEIIHPDGMQKYLSYCVKNGITPKAIRSLGYGEVNVMNLYEEKNGNYKIIAEMNIGDDAIVLAHNPNNPSPYVTWSTSSDRRWGYTAGNYWGSFTSAFRDFEERCRGMFKGSIERKRINAKARKEKNHER